MKKILLLLIFILSLTGSYSQNLCKIQIIDEHGVAIPFVNVSFFDGKGLTSDANGQFVLDKESLLSDKTLDYQKKVLQALILLK